MCPPVIIGVGLAMMVAAAAMSSVQGIQAANAQNKQAKEQAKYIQNAQAVQDEDRRRKVASQIETQRALYGAAGLDSNLGSPTDVYANTAGNAAVDQYAADIQSNNQASAIKTSGENAVIGAWNDAFSNTLSTAGKALSSFGTGGAGGAAAGASAGVKG